MKQLLTLCFLLWTTVLSAQKPMVYGAYVGARYFQLYLELDSIHQVGGYYIDPQRLEKIAIRGRYTPLGEIWEIHTDEKNALFKTLRMRLNKENMRLQGFYYQWDGYVGRIDATDMGAVEVNYDDNRDTRNMNDLYRMILNDAKMPLWHRDLPFSIEPASGRFCLNTEEQPMHPRSIPMKGRYMEDFNSIHIVFRDAAFETKSELYELKAHYQILSYYPKATALVAFEEKVSYINKPGDTTVTERVSLAIYDKFDADKYGIEQWTNITETSFTKDLLEKLKSKLPEGKYEMDGKSIRLEFPREAKLFCSTPRVSLFVPVPGQKEVYTNFIWNWKQGQIMELE